MATPDELGAMVTSNLFSSDVLSQSIKYVGYFLFAGVLLAILVVVWYLLQYRYKVKYPILHYSDDKKSAQIVGYKTDRARDVIFDGVRKQQLLFARKTIEPFREEDVHPEKKIFMLKINEDGTYITMPSLIFESKISNFESLKPEEKYWAILQLKENAKTYASDDAQKKAMIMVITTVIFCLIAVGVTAWLCLKAPNRAVDAFDAFGKQFITATQSMGGVPPG